MLPVFSVVVVCFNPGEKLYKTIASICAQTYRQFEIIVKDGNSSDGSTSNLAQNCCNIINSPTYPTLMLMKGKDKGIYDAMNIAVNEAQGDFVIFMNCGDTFYDEKVLERVAEFISQEGIKDNCVLYGDVYAETTNTLISSPAEITGFTCFRNIPCHQACFYSRDLFDDTLFNLEYRIRADYDHFLNCFYKKRSRFLNLEITVASYEGGGYSESAENRERDALEHELITKEYMSLKELITYKTMMALTLAPVRRAMSDNPRLAKGYQKVKRILYKGLSKK